MLPLWLKAFHVIGVVTWFAGLFYLPRLFVYHAEAGETAIRERFKVMERRQFPEEADRAGDERMPGHRVLRCRRQRRPLCARQAGALGGEARLKA